MNAQLLSAIEAVWDAAKASPEKYATSRTVLNARKVKLRADLRREDAGGFGATAIVEIIDRGPA